MKLQAAAVSIMAFASLAACAGCREKTPAPPGSDDGAPPPKAAPREWSPEQQKVVNLAKEFLKKNGTDWGEPEAVNRQGKDYETEGGKGEDVFWVSYATPTDEVKVLGPRSVVVNVRTGKAAFVPRD
jgi:hypothetical protein